MPSRLYLNRANWVGHNLVLPQKSKSIILNRTHKLFIIKQDNIIPSFFRSEDDRAAKRKTLKNKGKTEAVANNGFNPVWKQRFHFEVRVPSLAFLEFQVKDYSKSGRDCLLGAFCSPLTLIQEGHLIIFVIKLAILCFKIWVTPGLFFNSFILSTTQ